MKRNGFRFPLFQGCNPPVSLLPLSEDNHKFTSLSKYHNCAGRSGGALQNVDLSFIYIYIYNDLLHRNSFKYMWG